jgi:hypothetical protein
MQLKDFEVTKDEHHYEKNYNVRFVKERLFNYHFSNGGLKLGWYGYRNNQVNSQNNHSLDKTPDFSSDDVFEYFQEKLNETNNLLIKNSSNKELQKFKKSLEALKYIIEFAHNVKGRNIVKYKELVKNL